MRSSLSPLHCTGVSDAASSPPWPRSTPDLLFEELWRVLGACLLTSAVVCYALKVGCQDGLAARGPVGTAGDAAAAAARRKACPAVGASSATLPPLTSPPPYPILLSTLPPHQVGADRHQLGDPAIQRLQVGCGGKGFRGCGLGQLPAAGAGCRPRRAHARSAQRLPASRPLPRPPPPQHGLLWFAALAVALHLVHLLLVKTLTLWGLLIGGWGAGRGGAAGSR